MSVKEVTQLRKAGKLKEAFALAKEELNEERNAWTSMSMFWVLRDMALNLFIPNNNLPKAQQCLEHMRALLSDMIDENGIAERAFQSLSKQLQPNASIIQKAGKLSKTDPTAAYLQITEALGTSVGNQIDNSMHEEYGWIIYRYIKTNMETLESVQIRSLLHEYMQLSNGRPSMLHSMILNFAINYSKTHLDFVFYRFLMMWGIENLREDDFSELHTDGHVISSLISRICKTLIDNPSQFNLQEFVNSFKEERRIEVVEHLRNSIFWNIMNQHKNGDTNDQLCATFNSYANNYSSFKGSHWHSEILKIANRFIPDEYGQHYFTFVRNWYGEGNFLHEDWLKTVAEDGKEYPSLVVKTAKRCYEILKMDYKLRRDMTQIEWLKSLYQTIYKHDSDDDWSIRIYATLCKWTGHFEETINIYRKLLLDMGEKYYLWSELADCIQENNSVKTGLLLKALKLERNEDFLGNIRLALAEAWIREGFGYNARTELDSYIKHRCEKGWNVSEECNRLSKELAPIADVRLDYTNNYIQQAEDFVYSDHEWKNFVLTERWTHNSTEHCYFYDGQALSFTVKAKRFPILKKAQLGDMFSWRCYIKTNSEIIPLIGKKMQLPKWSILPLTYGAIDYINTEKKTLHIITQDNKQLFAKQEKQPFKVGDLVGFRQYQKEYKNENITCIVDIKNYPKKDILDHMPSGIVVVDDVNETKQLFHVYLKPLQISGSVRFDETSLRPQIGDFLHICYYIKKSKDGEKFLKILNMTPTNEEIDGVKDTVHGSLTLKYKDYNVQKEYPDFGFINGYYVHKKLLMKYNITRECDVIAYIILGADNKWKVYNLKLITE